MIKKDFEKYINLKGDWHIHTNYTDGKNSVLEYCKQAEKNNLELIAFTEHVRSKLTYSFDDFVSDVHSAKDKFKDIVILTGCEAKLLNGKLDVSKEVLKQCEVVLGAIHSDNDYWDILNLITIKDIDVYAHPSTNSFSLGQKHNIARLCGERNVLIEKNKKHGIDNEFIEIANRYNCKVVNSSDAHNISELLSYRMR